MSATRHGSQQKHPERRSTQERRRAASLALHPSSELVPAMSAAAYTQLRADIERRGIQTPLDITAGSVLLDGRSRLQAAVELGQEQLPVRIVAPADEVEYMVLAAIERRHLTPSQTAALLVEWSKFDELREAGAKRPLQNLRQYTEGATLPPRGKLRDLLAALCLGVPLCEVVVPETRSQPRFWTHLRVSDVAFWVSSDHSGMAASCRIG